MWQQAAAVVNGNHHHGSYLPGHAQPPTDIFSHVWCESDQNDGCGSIALVPLLSPVTAAATEAAHMNVCYPHTSHTNRHTPPPGSKERKSEREGGRDVAGKEEVKKGSDSPSCGCTLYMCYRERRVLFLLLPCKLQLRWEESKGGNECSRERVDCQSDLRGRFERITTM